MSSTSFKSTPAQLKAAKVYRTKKQSQINEHMMDYYKKNRDTLLKKKRDKYYIQKQLKLEKLLSKDTL